MLQPEQARRPTRPWDAGAASSEAPGARRRFQWRAGVLGGGADRRRAERSSRGPRERVPVYAFAAALYGSSPYFSQWGTEVSRERLERDLALGPAEFMAVFDVDPSSRRNAEMLQGFARLQVQVPADEAAPETAAGEANEVDQGEIEEGLDEGLAAGGIGADTASYSTRPLSEPVPYQERGSDELTTEARSRPIRSSATSVGACEPGSSQDACCARGTTGGCGLSSR